MHSESKTSGLAEIGRSVRNWLNAGLSFFYPEVCQVCNGNRATPSESFVCSKCRDQVRWITEPVCDRCGRPFEGAITGAFECWQCRELEPAFDYARSAALGRDPVLDIIRRYKYDGALWFEGFLGELLVRGASADLPAGTWDVIVPVPLHPTKKRERGFNQAERLARRLGHATGIPVDAGLVRRVLPTRTQTRLSREERLKNVKGAFTAKRARAGLRVVVVDDVMTTGATTSACAAALKEGGADAVCVWTVARGT